MFSIYWEKLMASILSNRSPSQLYNLMTRLCFIKSLHFGNLCFLLPLNQNNININKHASISALCFYKETVCTLQSPLELRHKIIIGSKRISWVKGLTLKVTMNSLLRSIHHLLHSHACCIHTHSCAHPAAPLWVPGCRISNSKSLEMHWKPGRIVHHIGSL